MALSASAFFRQKLRALREAKAWTQEQAAEACSVGYKLFQLYELGIKDNPGLKTLEKIAKGFGITLPELLTPSARRSTRRPKRRSS